MPAEYWSSADLKGLPEGGWINEDVMQSIIDISKINLTLTDMIGSTSVGNSYCSWPKDKLSDVDMDNHKVDGADASGNDAKGGTRVGNHCQISTKVIEVTTRARHSDTIGYSDEYSRQVLRRTDELRRDLEAISCSNQASQEDNGDNTPGKIGAMNAWFTTNTDRGATGADGGFTGGAVNAATLGTTRAISETAIRDVCQAVYMSGGDPSILMARPDVIRRVSEYMFGDTARIGTQQTETKESRNVAVGTVKVFITDFDVELVMTDNRLMKTMNHASDDDNDSAYILDPKLWDHGFLHSFRTEPLAKKGLSDRAQVAVDWTLKCYAEEGNGVIADIDATAPMVG